MDRKNKGLRRWNIAVILLLFCVTAFVGYRVIVDKANINDLFNFNKDVKKDNDNNDDEIPIPKPKLKIMDLDSKTRPIGIMVDNEKGAWPQAGLQDAYLVYEIIVEGGETRFFALFKDKDTAMIGPDRSARHYFLDYAMENDAIFTHYGFSPQAESDIKTYGINDISGTEKDGGSFWREKIITTNWQNCFTSIKKLMTRAVEKGYRVTSTQPPILNYSVDELDFSTNVNAKVANKVVIYYSKTQYVTYDYDSINKVYNRSQRGKAQLDRVTNLQYTTKNIIVYNVDNYNLNDEPGKGRQGINNIGNGIGYYITDGYAIPITWSKASREAKTIYKDSTGTLLKVNDGNTFINLQPLNKTLTIE